MAKTLRETVGYVALETSKLSQKILGVAFPISSLTIFAHSDEEYELLVNQLNEIGEEYNYNNGPRVVLSNPIVVDDNIITHLRIRKPDTERPQVGCNDFDTDYKLFKSKYLDQHTENLRLIIRPEYEMIEFHDPAFNVLAYVVSKQL